MENVLLVIHLMVCIGVVVLVLMQRSEGGALGIGGGSGALMSGRGAADLIVKITGFAGAAFFLTSLALTFIGGTHRSDGSVVDRAQTLTPPPISAPATPAAPTGSGSTVSGTQDLATAGPVVDAPAASTADPAAAGGPAAATATPARPPVGAAPTATAPAKSAPSTPPLPTGAAPAATIPAPTVAPPAAPTGESPQASNPPRPVTGPER